MSRSLPEIEAEMREQGTDGCDAFRPELGDEDMCVCGCFQWRHLVKGWADELALVASGWQDIATAPKVHPLNGGDDLLLYWNVPGINEPITVVGQWRDGWWSGSNKAFPTHWMPVPAPPQD